MTISKKPRFLHALDPNDPASKHMTLAFSRSFCNSSATSVAWETNSFHQDPSRWVAPIKKGLVHAELGFFYLEKVEAWAPTYNQVFWAHFEEFAARINRRSLPQPEIGRMKGTLWGFMMALGSGPC